MQRRNASLYWLCTWPSGLKHEYRVLPNLFHSRSKQEVQSSADGSVSCGALGDSAKSFARLYGGTIFQPSRSVWPWKEMK